VTAYYFIALNGKSGEIYNISSGKGTKIKEILDIPLSFLDKIIDIKFDLSQMEPSEVPVLVGEFSKLHLATQWNLLFQLRDSLQDIYCSWLDRL
jgi:GDP-4-dehydro-6-deoxy-D-mannose reductase